MSKSSKEQFGAFAEAYVTSKNHAKGDDLSLLEQIIEKETYQAAVDIATGGGHVAKKLATYVKDVVAVDLTPEMLTVAKKQIDDAGLFNVQYIEAAAENFPFADEQFDLAVNRIAAHHFKDVPKFLTETYRILQKGARFYLLDNVALENRVYDKAYNELEKKRDSSHVRAYKKSEWLSMMEEAGFTITFLRTFEKTFDYQDWTDRVQFTEKEKQGLAEWIIEQPLDVKRALDVHEVDNEVIRFSGQSILLEVVKK